MFSDDNHSRATLLSTAEILDLTESRANGMVYYMTAINLKHIFIWKHRTTTIKKPS